MTAARNDQPPPPRPEDRPEPPAATGFLLNLVAALQVTAILLVVASIAIAFAYLVFVVIL